MDFLNNIPDRYEDITLPWLQSVLQYQQKDPELKILDDELKITSTSKIGEHFASSMNKVTIRVVNGKKEEETKHLIFKQNATHPMFKEMLNKLKLFDKETAAYMDYLPELKEFIDSNSKNPFKLNIPDCIFAKVTEQGSILIMENLKLSGYKMADAAMGVGNEHMQLILTALARYHGASIAMRVKAGQDLEEKYPIFKQGGYPFDDPDQPPFLTMAMGNAVQLLGMSEKHHNLKDRLEKFIENNAPIEKFVVSVMNKKNKDDPHRSLLHGDYWINNLMFKYGEDGNPTAMIMLDWQIVRSGIPSIEFCYILYLATRPETRKKYLKSWMDLFTGTLRKTLKEFGLDALADSYTDEKFEKEFRNQRPVTVTIALSLLPGILSKMIPEDEKEFAKMGLDNFEKEHKEMFEQGLNEEVKKFVITIVQEMAEDGII